MNHIFDANSGLYVPNSISANTLRAFSGTGYGGGNAGYDNSMLDWSPLSTNADSDIVMNHEVLRQRSRDLSMNESLANGALKKIVSNVVGGGLRLNSQINHKYLSIKRKQAEKIETQIEFEFNLWADKAYNCDSAGTLNFNDMQRLVLLSVLVSGDVFVFLPSLKRNNSIYDLKLKIVESDRIQDPPAKDMTKNILGGVEIDKKTGLPTHYHVVNQLPNAVNFAALQPTEWQRIPIRGESSGRLNVIHLFTVERPEQRRGIPLLSPVIKLFKQLSRYSEAEIMAAVVSGMLSVFIESENPTQVPFQDWPKDPREKIKYDNVSMTPGMILALKRGDKVNVANPGRPNPNYEGFINTILRQIGVSLEIPFEVLLGHFQSSYSASRAAILAAWQVFDARRKWLVEHFCQPVYEEWLTEAVLKGRVNLPGFLNDPAIKAAWCRADFYGPAMPQIDPGKEVAAAKARFDGGFTTMAYETAQLTGQNFDETHKINRREVKQLDKARRSTKPVYKGTESNKGKNNGTKD